MKSKKPMLATVVISLSILITGCLSILGAQEPQINKEDTTMIEEDIFAETTSDIEESCLETMMLEYIEEDILDGYEPISLDEAVKILNQMAVLGSGITEQNEAVKEIIRTPQDLRAIVVPDFLPERFIARGVFAKDNLGITGDKMLLFLWYDPENLEVLMVWPGRYSYDTERQFLLTDTDEIGRKVNEISPWINYSASCEYAQDGVGVHGLMFLFLNSEDNFDDCEKILKSLKR